MSRQNYFDYDFVQHFNLIPTLKKIIVYILVILVIVLWLMTCYCEGKIHLPLGQVMYFSKNMIVILMKNVKTGMPHKVSI